MKKSVEKLDKFHLYLIAIFCAAVFFLLLQSLGVSETKLAGKVITGAVTILDDLRDFASIVGAPNSQTKIVTSASPTATETRIANYLASNYMLCGNSQIETGENCEISTTSGESEEQFFVRCPNCKSCGDGMLDDINPTTGLMEQCDPGDANFVPMLSAINSCSANAQCQTGANCGLCPSGSVSTNVCAYGIFKTISDTTNTYPYYYAAGNLNCEAGAENSLSDCTKLEQTCGITMREILAVEMGNASITDNDAITILRDYMGYPQTLADGLALSRFVTLYYNESEYSSFRLQIIKFPTRAMLEAYISHLNTTAEILIGASLGSYSIFIANSTDMWLWAKGDILYVLTYGSPSPLSFSQRQQGNAILFAYLNQFGSDIPAATTTAVCGDSICNGDETVSSCSQDCPAVCGDSVISASETCEPTGSSCTGGICSNQCVCDKHIIEQNIASSLGPYFTYLATAVYNNEPIYSCPPPGQSPTTVAAMSNRYYGYYLFDANTAGSTGSVNIIEAISPSTINDIITAEIRTDDTKLTVETYCRFSTAGLTYESDSGLWWIWRTRKYNTNLLVSLKVEDSALTGAKLNDLVTWSQDINDARYIKANQVLSFYNAYLNKFPVYQPS